MRSTIELRKSDAPVTDRPRFNTAGDGPSSSSGSSSLAARERPLRYTVQLNDRTLSPEAAEKQLRQLLGKIKVARVFGFGRNASIDVLSADIEDLRHRLGKVLTFQRALEASDFSE